MPPNLRSESTRLPVDVAGAPVAAGGLEQLRDEIEARLHGDHEAFFQHPGEAQIRMPVGPGNIAAVRGAHEAADVMDLEAEQMADPVGQEDAGDAGGHCFLAVAGGEVGLAQEVAEEAVGLQVDVAPVDPGLDARAEGLLHPVHAADQGGEVGVAMGVGPGDVAGIAGELRAGVDEERSAARPGATFSSSW